MKKFTVSECVSNSILYLIDSVDEFLVRPIS